MQAGLAVKSSVREAWEAIHKVTAGIDRVKEANAEQLHREFDDIAFKPGETMEDFTLRINNLAN
jgi:hypothetical protein